MNPYVEEEYESEQFRTFTRLENTILDAKYNRSDFYKVMKIKCQHLKETKRNEQPELLKKRIVLQ